MAKTNRTNSHSEEPTRHSNRTSGKSPPSVALTAHKPASARKATSARKDTAASPLHGGSEKFSGERKGPPEAIVPAPEAGVVHAWVGQKLLNCFIFKCFTRKTL